jgi:GxxExxY protein
MEIFYKGVKVGVHKLDLFVGGEVVVEVKAVPELTKEDKAQAISYAKAVGKEDVLLLNFWGTEPNYERLFYNKPEQQMALGTVREVRDVRDVRDVRESAVDYYYAPALVYKIQGALFEVFRDLTSGFVHRIYANACYHELRWRGLAPLDLHDFNVIYKGKFIDSIKFRHLRVQDILIFPIAHTDPKALPIITISEHLGYYNLPLAIIANFQTERLLPIIIRNFELK